MAKRRPSSSDKPVGDDAPHVGGHLPVLPGASIEALKLVPGSVVVDCTAGGGGHLRRFAAAVGDTGRVIGLDRDERAFADDAAGGVAKTHANVTLVRRPFSEIRQALDDLGIDRVDAVFADLGVSSFQLDEGERGFSFRFDAPLDMRMDRRDGETAAELIARLEEDDLANVIYRYGDERLSRRIAKVLKRELPTTTDRLKDLVASCFPGPRGRIHPATKTFQALRIAVNGELDQLETLIAALPNVLVVGGRAGFLTFHSLEDRLVKQAFLSPGFEATTRKPIVADDDELDVNPRARSAKLRVAGFDPGFAGGPRRHRSKYADLAGRDDDGDDAADDAVDDDDTND
ncbi:MAG TPA: 16S rRNA (cytosine(1402)-N(4))-methyltransferase RsmH [Myxococcota bacterium]